MIDTVSVGHNEAGSQNEAAVYLSSRSARETEREEGRTEMGNERAPPRGRSV